MIEVGPGWYVEKQPVKIEAKDILEIRGSRVMSQGKPAIIAAEYKKRESDPPAAGRERYPRVEREESQPGK